MIAARAGVVPGRVTRPGAGVEVGCVVGREVGVVVVLTDRGPVRATYGARLLEVAARDRLALPEPGEWVTVRRWRDGPVTVEAVLGADEPGPSATVVPLHGARPRSTGRP